MHRREVSGLLSLFVALALAIPAAAGTAVAKDLKSTVDILSTTSLAGKQLKPGTYTVIAEDTKVTLQQGSKVVAEAPVQWKDESSKANNTRVVSDNGQVKEIHFGGKMRYLEVSE